MLQLGRETRVLQFSKKSTKSNKYERNEESFFSLISTTSMKKFKIQDFVAQEKSELILKIEQMVS